MPVPLSPLLFEALKVEHSQIKLAHLSYEWQLVTLLSSEPKSTWLAKKQSATSAQMYSVTPDVPPWRRHLWVSAKEEHSNLMKVALFFMMSLQSLAHSIILLYTIKCWATACNRQHFYIKMPKWSNICVIWGHVLFFMSYNTDHDWQKQSPSWLRIKLLFCNPQMAALKEKTNENLQ